ncbi:MAG: rRNA pseudouridine synthase [Clostridia bacterium]|nr:rRNA pseudouridine synthase [Clostridia bacterium]
MRINKYLAECGLASRRKSEQFVLDGMVSVNGKVVRDLSFVVEAGDVVSVNGEIVSPNKDHVYLMLNKPKGCVTTVSDDRGRKTVMDIVSKDFAEVRLFPVGRLDYDTEGLLILTTDGDLCNRLTHPSLAVTKTYLAKVEGQVSESDLNKLRAGIEIDGKMTSKCKCKIKGFDADKKITQVEIRISEGMNRQVRKMFEAIGKSVAFLKRVAIGDLRLRGVDRGGYRKLSQEEVEYLKRL